MSATPDRLFVDDAMVSLVAAEAHVMSLLADVKVRDEMIAELLTALRSHTLQIERLMYTIRHSEPTRG